MPGGPNAAGEIGAKYLSLNGSGAVAANFMSGQFVTAQFVTDQAMAHDAISHVSALLNFFDEVQRRIPYALPSSPTRKRERLTSNGSIESDAAVGLRSHTGSFAPHHFR